MTEKFLRGPAALFVFILAVFMWPAVCEAQTGPTPSPTPAPTASAPDASGQQAAPTINKEEEDAYNALYTMRTGLPESQIKLAEDFIKKFPDSHYLSSVYAQLTGAYYASGDEDKMFVAGAKAIELNPDNVDILALLAMTIPRRVRPTTPDGAQQLVKAEAYAHHAIELIPLLPKPPDVDDAAFEKARNEKLSMAHSGLGLIDYNHSKYEDARIELTQAIQLVPDPDPVDFYLLGNADERANYFNDAAAAFDKCSAAGPLVEQCKTLAENAKHDATTKMGK